MGNHPPIRDIQLFVSLYPADSQNHVCFHVSTALFTSTSYFKYQDGKFSPEESDDERFAFIDFVRHTLEPYLKKIAHGTRVTIDYALTESHPVRRSISKYDYVFNSVLKQFVAIDRY